MRSTAMVFRGSPQVLGAYMANDMPSWAICNGKSIMFASEETDMTEGEASLREALEMLRKGGSKAIFELRVYELSPKTKILSNTPHARGIPFTLFDDEEDLAPYDQRRRGYMQQVEERLEAQDKQILALKEQLADAEEQEMRPEGINGFLAGIIEDPLMKQTLVQALAGIVRKIVPMQPGPAAVAGIEGPGGQQQTLTSVLIEGQPEKIQQAINLLCTKDPRLGDHLLAIASIAMTDINKYNYLVGMLANT